MTKRSIVALFGAAAIALPASAWSEEPARGWYIGAELGQASFADEDDTAFKLLGGYRINRHFAAEGGYAWLFDKDGAEVTAFELVALGSFPVANQFFVLGKLGLANVYAEGPTIDEEKVELTYGLGVQYDMTRQIGIRGQWQRYDSSEEVDLFSIGVVWRF
jgi:outer membrane immunogenic protein